MFFANTGLLFALASPAHFSFSVVNDLPTGKYLEKMLCHYSKTLMSRCQGKKIENIKKLDILRLFLLINLLFSFFYSENAIIFQ